MVSLDIVLNKGDNKMVKKLQKLPAGLFLVPMILSMIVYTIAPDLMMTGGMVQSLFSGEGVGFIVAALTFYSGTNLNLKRLVRILKRHGIILVVKGIVSVIISLLYIRFFGQEGVLGVSALAFVVAISSTNPAVYMSTVDVYGNEDDPAAYGITGLFSIPLFPIIVYSLLSGTSGGGMDWTPVFTTLIPLVVGLILGNIDTDFSKVFTPGIGAILPLLGWNLGQGMNLVEALKAGGSGFVLLIMFLVINLYIIFLDNKVLKNDGIVGFALLNVAGVSTSTPAVIGALYPALAGSYVSGATSQVLLVCVVTSILTPILTQWQYKRVYGKLPVDQIEV